MKDFIPAGSADRSVFVFVPDPASTDGSGKTSLAHTDMTVTWARMEDDNDVVTSAITLANLASITAAHTDWGWEEVSSSAAPGLYRLDIGDNALAAGAWYVVIYVMITSSSAAASPMEIVLTGSIVNQIYSDTTSIASNLAVADGSDVLSRLTVMQAILSDVQSDTNAVLVKVGEADFSDIISLATKIYSDTTAIEAGAGALTSDQNSKLTMIATKIGEADFSDIISLATKIYSDTTLCTDDVVVAGTAAAGSSTSITLDGAGSGHATNNYYSGDIVVIRSGTGLGQARLITAYDGTTKVATTAPVWVTNPDNTSVYMVLAIPGAPEGDISDVLSLLTKTYSDTTAIEFLGGILTTAQDSMLSQIHSAMVEVNTSDIHSLITAAVVTDGDISDVLSRLTVMQAVLSDVQSDTNVMVPILSDVQSDTNALLVKITEADTSDILSCVTAIKAKTDSLTYTTAGQVDANIQSVNDTAVAGTGTSGDPWGP